VTVKMFAISRSSEAVSRRYFRRQLNNLGVGDVIFCVIVTVVESTKDEIGACPSEL
jgi:hypothetical protein